MEREKPITSLGQTRFTAATITIACVISSGIVVHSFRTQQSDQLPEKNLTQQNLADIDTAALLAFQPSRSTCDEILRRDAVSTEHLTAALLFLARQQRVPTLRVLVQRTQQLTDQSSTAELVNLTRLFADLVAKSDGWRDSVVELTHGDSAQTRRVAYATQILIDDGLESVVHPDAPDDQIAEVLRALPLVASESLQQAMYDDVKRVISDKQTAALTRNTAIEISAQLSGRQAEKTRDLVALLRNEQDMEPSLRAINRIPAGTWPDDQIGFLAAGLISWVAEQSDIGRNSKQTALARTLSEKLTQRLEPSKRARFQNRMSELLGD